MSKWAMWRTSGADLSLRWSPLALCLLVNCLVSPWNSTFADDPIAEPVLTAPDGSDDASDMLDESSTVTVYELSDASEVIDWTPGPNEELIEVVIEEEPVEVVVASPPSEYERPVR